MSWQSFSCKVVLLTTAVLVLLKGKINKRIQGKGSKMEHHSLASAGFKLSLPALNRQGDQSLIPTWLCLCTQWKYGQESHYPQLQRCNSLTVKSYSTAQKMWCHLHCNILKLFFSFFNAPTNSQVVKRLFSWRANSERYLFQAAAKFSRCVSLGY